MVQHSTKRCGAAVRGTVKPHKDAAIAQQRALKSGVIKGVKLRLNYATVPVPAAGTVQYDRLYMVLYDTATHISVFVSLRI